LNRALSCFAKYERTLIDLTASVTLSRASIAARVVFFAVVKRGFGVRVKSEEILKAWMMGV
jgi:hypothetical protein